MNDNNTGFDMKRAQEIAMKDRKPIYYKLSNDQLNELSELLMKKIMMHFNEILVELANKNQIELNEFINKWSYNFKLWPHAF